MFKNCFNILNNIIINIKKTLRDVSSLKVQRIALKRKNISKKYQKEKYLKKEITDKRLCENISSTVTKSKKRK